MNRYNSTPSASADSVPAQWPLDAGSPLQLLESERGTIAMFVHPKCPCTRASIAELSRLATSSVGSFEVLILLVKPPGAGDDWEQTDLRESALEIPGARVLCDTDGRIATRFGAVTSGETYFYDRLGQLRFHGGLTNSRGHHGQNAGRTFIAGYRDKKSKVIPGSSSGASPVDSSGDRFSDDEESSAIAIFETPVFGCALFATPISANQGT